MTGDEWALASENLSVHTAIIEAVMSKGMV